jgi:hypothetical protein
MKGTHYHAQLLVEMGLKNFVPGMAWNNDLPNLSLPSS